ncbi:MAG: hypothetical protein ACK56W_03985 [Pirellula sp.]|nr:hypothetical protein [Pirellula sp.]
MSHGLSLRLSFVAAMFALVGQTAIAQTPTPNSWRTSPLNTFARFHGIGYSDGYHACKGSDCGPKKTWFLGENVSSFYGEPTAPTARAVRAKQPSYASYQASQQQMRVMPRQYDVELSPGMSFAHIPESESLHATPPSPPFPIAPQSLQFAPISPMQSASPSDRLPYDAPRSSVGSEPEAVLPLPQKPQTRRVVPGTHSLMISQG